MPFINCIQGHVTRGLITDRQARALEREYNELVQRYSQTIGSQQAADQAATKLVKLKADRLAAKKKSDIIAAQFQLAVGQQIDARFKAAKAEFNRLSKTQQKLVAGFGGRPTFSTYVRDFLDTVAANQQHVIAEINLPLVDLFKREPLFFDDKNFNDLMRDAVGHMLGRQASTAQARQVGDALIKAFDLSHAMYTRAGGLVGRLQNYFPQAHSPDKLQNLVDRIGKDRARDTWRNDLLSKLDRSKMIDEETGQPFTDAVLKKIMDEDFETILTDGLNKVHKIAEQGKQLAGLGSDINKRRDKSRFYHFRDADSFFDYNQRFGFGNENLFDVAVSHLATIGRDIGTAQKMGPQPASVMRNLNLRMAGDSVQSVYWTNASYDAISGALSAGGKEPAWYRVLNADRNLLRASMLGSATISAIGDPLFAKLMARRNGLPGFSIVDNIKTIWEQGGIDSQSIRQFLTASDYLAGSSVSRFGEDPTSFGDVAVAGIEKFTAKAAEFTHRASGLNYWTAIQETATTMGVEGSTFHARGKPFSALEKAHQDALTLFGIDAAQWDIIRAAQPKVVGARQAKYVGAAEVAALGNSRDIRQAAQNYGSFIRGLTAQALNNPLARTRAIQTGGQRAGTLLRAFIQSSTQFKGFAFTVMFNHALPALQQAARGNFRDIGWLLAATVPIGALAIQMRELLKGNDPRPVDNLDFWKASALQSGGLGPFGDFLFSEHGRFGRSPLIDMILGPVGGQVDDMRRITLGNFERALDDPSYESMSKFTSDAYKFASYHIPGQNLWYARNLIEAVTSAPLEYFDPNYAIKRDARIKKQQKEFGSKPFWYPGEFLPRRAPDFGNIVE